MEAVSMIIDKDDDNAKESALTPIYLPPETSVHTIDTQLSYDSAIPAYPSHSWIWSHCRSVLKDTSLANEKAEKQFNQHEKQNSHH
jgi:hypothetical protein